ncbi:hypothetical protein Geob_3190 [Geotalea daltonii FRC-32]|uniref:Uncharacterized protein n=1 Tax=Geotalea daltonii (strain DSM 22248 / JCM 15807 / FRC-32) TaxID=316067 RepID=B9M478_GEODF|nr:hypothetical protein [Geotalea daltonii]ACM21533.1 hypothetical protein Geob_3190 [Geotalea daltonii FRC-32]
MAILGTKKFWKPAQGAANSQQESQILKNTGYINIQLYCVNYMSVGNFWQNVFGGSDTIALATNIKYDSGVESIEATSVQDIREVAVNRNYDLGLQRNIAVKIPANADALSINVKMTAVNNDLLQAKFDMLNKPEYQAALQLAPTVVGQVLTITSLVKKLFTDSDPHSQLEASYAGIISSQSESNPVSKGKLTSGYLIMISTNDGDQFNQVDESKFEMKGDALYYKDKQVENTYIVFNISFEPYKGDDEKANWFKKYMQALNNLDQLQIVVDQNEVKKVFNDSKTMWIEGNALIDADNSYINSERTKIKSAAIMAIKDKYQELTKAALPPSKITQDVVSSLVGLRPIGHIEKALPLTANYMKDKGMLPQAKGETMKPIQLDQLSKITQFIDEDTTNYLKDLKLVNMKTKLSFKSRV